MRRTRVSLPLGRDFLPLRYESLWAHQSDDGSRSLLNSSFFLPLAVGDVVTTLPHEGRSIITGLITPGEMALSHTVLDPSVSPEEALGVTDAWRSHGAAWTEGMGDVLATVWTSAKTADEVFAFLREDLRDRAGWHTPLVFSPADREFLLDELLREGLSDSHNDVTASAGRHDLALPQLGSETRE